MYIFVVVDKSTDSNFIHFYFYQKNNNQNFCAKQTAQKKIEAKANLSFSHG